MNSNMLKFSVIVPVYNVSKYINCCVQSILNQTYTNFELILVDDGATDDSGIICDKYASLDPRITVIHKKNGGLVQARCAGARIAIGDYIACIDGDDWVAEQYLESFYKVIKKYKADIVCGGYIRSVGDKSYKIKFNAGQVFYNKHEIMENIFPYLIHDLNGRYIQPNIWAKVFKRELYVKNQLRVPNIRLGEDFLVTIPCIYSANTIAINENCEYFYRFNQNSITQGGSFDWNESETIFNYMASVVDNQDMFIEQLKRREVHNIFNIAMSQFRQKCKQKMVYQDIYKKLDSNYVKTIVNGCEYNLFTKGELAKIIIKHKIVFAIKIIWLLTGLSLKIKYFSKY